MFRLGLIACALVAPVSADPHVGLGSVRLGEGIDPQLASAVRSEALAGFAPSHVDVADISGDCVGDDRTCLRQLAADSGLDFVVEVDIRFVDPDIELELQLVDIDGRELAKKSSICEICGEAELLELVRAEAAALTPRFERLGERPGRLALSGTPAGATVSINGEVVGTMPYSGELPAGEYELRVDARGFVSHERRIELDSGVEEQMTIQLARAPTRGGLSAKNKRVLGGSLLGVGLAALGSGAALWALNGREHQGTCPADSLDVNGACPNVYTTQNAAIGTLAGGAAVTIAGAVFLGLGLRNERVGVAVSPRSFTIEGRF